MPSSATSVVTRAVVSTLLDPQRRRAIATALGRLERWTEGRPLLDPNPRHPMAPAAVRIERTRSTRRRAQTEQVAVTMWFGEGPALPAPGGRLPRGATRVGVGILSAAAVAAVTALSARPAPKPRVVTPPEAPRLTDGRQAVTGSGPGSEARHRQS